MRASPRRPWSLGPLLATLFVLFALGCSAKYGGYGPGGGGGYGGYAEQDYARDYGGDYDGYAADEVTVAEAPMAEREEMRLQKKEVSRFKDKAKQSENRNSAAPAPTTTPTNSSGSVEPEPPAPPEPEEDPIASAGRQIIYTAGMGLSVFDVDDVMAKLEAIPERHGGWLQERYNNRIILRVPAAKLQTIITEITEYGVVEWKTLESLDVTAEYTDIDSRIRVLEQMQAHLQALLARAENVEQALEIQMELSRINAELEQLRAQMRLLESSIAFSTLAVDLHERGTIEPEPGDDPFPWVDELGAEATAYR